MKHKLHPQMAHAFKANKGFGVLIGRVKHNLAAGGGGEAALSRNAKLVGKAGDYFADGGESDGHIARLQTGEAQVAISRRWAQAAACQGGWLAVSCLSCSFLSHSCLGPERVLHESQKPAGRRWHRGRTRRLVLWR